MRVNFVRLILAGVCLLLVLFMDIQNVTEDTERIIKALFLATSFILQGLSVSLKEQ